MPEGLPKGVTQEPTGHWDADRFVGDDHVCPECGSEFAEFFSANYCPVCKEHVRGRATRDANLSQWSDSSD